MSAHTSPAISAPEARHLLGLGRAHTVRHRLRARRRQGDWGPRLQFLLATAELELGNDLAAHDLLADLAAGPRFTAGADRITLKLAIAAERLGRHSEAESGLRAVLATEPDHALARLRLAQLLIDSGSFGEARELLEPVADTARGCWLLGRILLLDGDADGDGDGDRDGAATRSGPSRAELERMDDPASIVLVTEPKSGTHWLRFLVANYLNLLTGPEPAVPLTHDDLLQLGLAANQRWFCCTGRDEPVAPHPVLAELGVPDLVWQHVDTREDTLAWSSARRVVMHRHPLDELVSRYHYFYEQRRDEHRRDSLGPVSGLPDVAERELVAIAGHRRRALIEAAGPNAATVIGYEQLRSDAAGHLARVLAALGLPVETGLVERAAAFSAIDEIHGQESAQGPIYDHIEGYFTRSGRVGQWRDELTSDQQEWALALLADLGVSVEDSPWPTHDGP